LGKIQPKQSPDNIIDFASKVKEHLDAKGRNASWLAQRARVSKTTITRLFNNTDHRGNPYHPDRGTVVAICLALRITREQRWELFNLAFPENAIINEALDVGYSVDDVNIQLEKKGLRPLTKP
jgi:hypothetical protein